MYNMDNLIISFTDEFRVLLLYQGKKHVTRPIRIIKAFLAAAGSLMTSPIPSQGLFPWHCQVLMFSTPPNQHRRES